MASRVGARSAEGQVSGGAGQRRGRSAEGQVSGGAGQRRGRSAEGQVSGGVDPFLLARLILCLSAREVTGARWGTVPGPSTGRRRGAIRS